MTVHGAHPLITSTKSWTQAEADGAIEARVQELRTQGVEAGQVFLFQAQAQAASVWTLHALMRLGAVAMPIDARLSAERIQALEGLQARPARTDTALRLLTSGTTGEPKVVDLTLRQLEASAQASGARLGHGVHDRWLCCMPLHHIGGLSVLFRSGFHNSTAELHTRFDPDDVNGSIADGATVVSLVPTMLSRVLDARGNAPFPQHLRAILLGGAPAPTSLIDRCRAIHAPVSLTWGMTETASQVATRSPGDLRADPDSGLPLPGMGVTVEDGVLVVHGPIAPDGCYKTSDLGQLDEEGRIIVLGRRDELIISGGENVAPTRVERILETHPSVQEVAVVGRPDPHWGQQPVAFLVGASDPEVVTWARNRLAPYERPAEAHWVSELPRNAAGKVDRSALSEEAKLRHGLLKSGRG